MAILRKHDATGAQAQAGAPTSSEALDHLISEHAREIQLFLFKLCGDHHDAEELAQDVFVKAYRRIHTLRDPGAARRWLYTIAVNHFNDWLKPKRRRFVRALGPLETQEVPGQVSEKPLREAFARELNQATMACIARLPNRQRMVLLLYSAKGFNYSEIGDALGITSDAAKMSLFYARERLRGQLEKLMD